MNKEYVLPMGQTVAMDLEVLSLYTQSMLCGQIDHFFADFAMMTNLSKQKSVSLRVTKILPLDSVEIDMAGHDERITKVVSLILSYIFTDSLASIYEATSPADDGVGDINVLIIYSYLLGCGFYVALSGSNDDTNKNPDQSTFFGFSLS